MTNFYRVLDTVTIYTGATMVAITLVGVVLIHMYGG